VNTVKRKKPVLIATEQIKNDEDHPDYVGCIFLHILYPDGSEDFLGEYEEAWEKTKRGPTFKEIRDGSKQVGFMSYIVSYL